MAIRTPRLELAMLEPMFANPQSAMSLVLLSASMLRSGLSAGLMTNGR